MSATHYKFDSIKTAETWQEEQKRLGHTVSSIWFDPKTEQTRGRDSRICYITKLHC